MPNLLKIRPGGAELFHAYGPRDKKLLAALRDFARVPKSASYINILTA